jgi:hypothetical protein
MYDGFVQAGRMGQYNPNGAFQHTLICVLGVLLRLLSGPRLGQIRNIRLFTNRKKFLTESRVICYK